MAAQPTVSAVDRSSDDELHRLVAILWPGATYRVLDRRAARDAARGGDLLVVPSVAGPRLLLPAGDRATLAHALRGTGTSTAPRDRLRRIAAAGAVRAGAGRALPGVRISVVDHDSGLAPATRLVDALAAETGLPIVAASARLGNARSNQKPVLALHGPDGSTLAYAKAGWNPLTADLVEDEARTLRRLDSIPLSVVRAPTVLALLPWHTGPVLVLAPLRARGPRPVSSRLLVTAVRELLDVSPPLVEELGRSSYVDDLLHRARRHLDLREGRRIHAIASRQRSRFEAVRLRFGRWHGDFRRWNMGRRGRRLLLWDWERSRTGMPGGMDLVHLHHPLIEPTTTPDQLRRRLADAAVGSDPVLGRLGLSASQVSVVRSLHLSEIVLRALDDARFDDLDLRRARLILRHLEEELHP